MPAPLVQVNLLAATLTTEYMPSIEDFVREQAKCPDMKILLASDKLKIRRHGKLVTDVFTGTARVLVPRSLRSRVVFALHRFHHPGRR